ncbi:MAG: hypothetical protein KC492_02740, partial [Myxococcales bacterium]|nr:hypothetical protein [Myxococcales bacterium]
TPNTDDCSQLRDTCAGLPADLWPPLESEVNGDPSNALSYERSYVKYLDKAKAASLEADRLGEEMLLFGLGMDEKAELAQKELDEECGADSHLGGECVDSATGAGGNVPGAALGDQQLCMWTYKGAQCACPEDGCPGGLTKCPFPAQSELAASEAAREENDEICRNEMLALTGLTALPAGFEPLAIPYTLKISATEPERVEFCGHFTALRYREDPFLAEDSAEVADLKTVEARREYYIRKYLMPSFGQATVQAIAERLIYREDFADNFALTYDGQEVFRTKRDTPLNSANAAPCTQSDESVGTGSRFWSNRINCFKSGTPQANEPAYQPGYPDTAVGCNDPTAGSDGCPGATARADVTWDTEPEALEERWAWGFGHLRRSAATLFVLTERL